MSAEVTPPTFCCYRPRPLLKMASSEREGAAGAGEEEERSTAPEDSEGSEDLQPHPSSLLSRRTLDELGQLQDADPDNYKLHSSWAFWFER